MRCNSCLKNVPKNDPHGLPWIHARCARRLVEADNKRKWRNDPEEILHAYGAEILSKTASGREVLNRARAKYKTELLQPGDPDFMKYYGKEVKAREEAKRENQEIARKMWANSESGQYNREKAEAEKSSMDRKRLIL